MCTLINNYPNQTTIDHTPVHTCIPQMPNQIALLQQFFSRFINQCDAALSSLNSALWTEHADTMTPNSSLYGYVISIQSNQQNYQAASQVDALQTEAVRINQMMQNMGIGPFQRLDTCFNGNAIRNAENNEHSFWGWFFTGDLHSTFSSMNTAREIEATSLKVQMVRNQAQNFLYMLPSFTFTMPIPTVIPAAAAPQTAVPPTTVQAAPLTTCQQPVREADSVNVQKQNAKG